jgi:two-component system response regulator ResD
MPATATVRSYELDAWEVELTQKPTILLVDPENRLLDLLELNLLRIGYRVVRANDGLEALRRYREQPFALVLMEVDLPKLDGFAVIKQLRSPGLCPVIMVSANNSEEAKIQGLEAGADDYITKPFSMPELLMRVKVALRRRQLATGPHYVTNNDRNRSLPDSQIITTPDGLSINKTARSVKLGQKEIELRPKEFDLLWFLASHPGQAFEREQLVKEVWNYAPVGDSDTVTVHMRRLREKIEVDPFRPRHLKTIWGIGYKFEA